MPVTIGVDPHKASHTTAALDEHGQLLDQQRIPATLDGYQQLRQWAGRRPQRCWAVEGAHGIGPGAGPAAGRRRRAGSGCAGQAGRPGAGAVGRPGPQERPRRRGLGGGRRPQRPPWPAAGQGRGPGDGAAPVDQTAPGPVAARTQTINRLHRLLVELVPGGARRNLSANRASALLAAVTPAGAPAVTPATSWPLI
jgi:transposase